MNICFIVDTSLSMSQIFDHKVSFLDEAKFIIEEISSNRLKYRNDKFFLVTTSEENNIVVDWEDCNKHFLEKVKVLQVQGYSLVIDINIFTWVISMIMLISTIFNITIAYYYNLIYLIYRGLCFMSNAITTALNLLNKYRQAPSDEIIFGRMPSHTETSSIIILTDGESFTNIDYKYNEMSRKLEKEYKILQKGDSLNIPHNNSLISEINEEECSSLDKIKSLLKLENNLPVSIIY